MAYKHQNPVHEIDLYSATLLVFDGMLWNVGGNALFRGNLERCSCIMTVVHNGVSIPKEKKDRQWTTFGFISRMTAETS